MADDGGVTEVPLPAAVMTFVSEVVAAWAVPGLAVAVVADGEILTGGFGSRTGRASEPVTADTLFHLASISKSFVATAVLRLVERGVLALDAPLAGYLPDVDWADPRAADITIDQVLSHTSGIDDVTDYGWHRPQTDDSALARFAAEVAGWPLKHDPGTEFAYSNAAYEVLGRVIETVSGQTFEAHLAEHVLAPLGMASSTFLRAEVRAERGAAPHLGLPPRVLAECYPYTRAHAPSSTLHSSARDLGVWMAAHLSGGGLAGVMSRETHAAMWEPRAAVEDWGDLFEQMARGWFRGTHRGEATIGHSGDDPGFQTNLTMLPERGIGVAVLANTNTAPIMGLTRGMLDVLLGQQPVVPTPPFTVGLGEVLTRSGVDAAVAYYRELAASEPDDVDLDEDAFGEAAWGAIEMHRPEEVADVLAVWHAVVPESSQAVTMSAWCDLVSGRREEGLAGMRRARELDPDNEDAAAMLERPPGP